jgi:hypothetical protein
MRRSNLATIVLVLLAFLSGAQAQAQTGERVQLKEGRVSFVPPAGFKPMSKEDINFKFGRNGAAYAPDVVYSNERQNVSVAVRLAPGRVTPAQLDEFQKAMEKTLEASIPGLEWIAREQLTLNGVRWIHFSLKAAAVDTGVYNEMYFTPFDDQVLIFNFNSTVAEHEKYKESLKQSAQTIMVKP